jgi:phenylpropionate dioxygenase-like ring-hydroxylating dioxygenase large terminal subunit
MSQKNALQAEVGPSLAVLASLPAEAYWQPEWFARERKVFFKNWIFAGFANQLSKPNDYVSFTIAGLPVVVRNMKDKLVAFRNVCSHRHSIIHPKGCGNAMFRCPYHGWTYDTEGVPIGIPDNAKSFGFDKEAKQKLALEPLALETCGNFVFVRVDAKGPSLKAWLGDFAEPLEHISNVLNFHYETIDQRWACNWKNRLEVIVEGYHVPMVHKASMSRHIKGVVPAAETEIAAMSDIPFASEDAVGTTEYSGPHSASFAVMAAPTLHHLDTVAKKLKLKQSSRYRGYDHFMLFPNMMFGINGGTNMCVERYEPVSPDQTDVHCWLTMGEMADPSLRGGIVWNTFVPRWIEFTNKLLDEDRIPCETTQLGVRFAHRRAVLGEIEERVARYQTVLCEQMDYRSPVI